MAWAPAPLLPLSPTGPLAAAKRYKTRSDSKISRHFSRGGNGILTLANSLRENHSEVIRRWHENLTGKVAEEFVQMLHTPMGGSVVTKLLSLAIEFLEAEEYEEGDVLHRVRSVAQESSFRRSAVGFCLPDIVFTALALRRAMEETVFNHALHHGFDEGEELLAGIMALNRFSDAMISGEIAGYFAYLEYQQEDDERVVA